MVTYRHSCIVVNDLKKAVKLYSKNFEMKVISEDYLLPSHSANLTGKSGMSLKYVKLEDCKGNIIELIEANHKINGHLSFTVTDIKSIYRKLKNTLTFYSEPFKAPDSGFKVCWAEDEDGNIIELVEPTTKK